MLKGCAECECCKVWDQYVESVAGSVEDQFQFVFEKVGNHNFVAVSVCDSFDGAVFVCAMARTSKWGSWMREASDTIIYE